MELFGERDLLPSLLSRRRGSALLPAAVLALAAVLVAACGEEAPQGPAAEAGGPASLAVTATIEAAGGGPGAQQSGGGLGAAYDAADVAAVRVETSGGSVLADREVAFDPGSGGAELSLELTIEDDRVPANLQLDLRRGADPLFEGSTGLTLVAGETTTAELSLAAVPAAVAVPEGPVTFTALGDSAELEAAVVFATGDTIPGREVGWSSGDPSVADVSEDGTVVADAPGETEAVASHEDLTASVAVEVDPEVATVAVEPDSTAFTSLSGTEAFAVQVTDANGNPVEDEPVTWTSTDVQVAAVDGEGLAEARGDGAAQVVAEAMGTADTASVTVDLGPTGQVAGEVGRAVRPSSSGAVSASASAGSGSASSVPTDPAGGVEVRFLQGGEVVSRTTTASDGTWTSPAIPPGTYTLEYASADLVTVRHPEVEITEGTTGSVAEVPMVPASDQPGAVAGTALNSRDGSGVAGATVELRAGFDAPDGTVVATGTAGADGSYEIGGVEPGTYTITGTAPDFAPDEITGVALGGETFGGQDLTLVPPPAVTIESPVDGATFSSSDPIPFEGSADDPEQGALGGDALVWTSDQLADPVGTGASFTTSLPAGDHTITLTATNDRGASGEASVGITVEQQTTEQPATGVTWVQIDAGSRHTCGVTQDGTGYCWGANSFGQLGDGTLSFRSSPVKVMGGISWEKITAAEFHTCGLATDGTAYCWGNNNIAGQLGDGTTTNSSTPVQVSGGITWEQVVAGGEHSCGVATDGTAYCWGRNDIGQLGVGDTLDRSTPTQVAGGISWQAIDPTIFFTCGLATDGTAHCWGDNFDGQLGDGTTTDRLTPVQVTGGITWQQVDAGAGDHSCGVATDGSAYCWGANFDGQLGVGDMMKRSSPAQVSGGITWQQVTAGGSFDVHTCGVDVDGLAWCWGSNSSGQLGDGTTSGSSTPVQVSGDITWQQVTGGWGSFTCGLATDGTAYCWGENGAGQLGDGTNTSRLIPTEVSNP